MSSSPIPVLSDVLFYTESDSYDFMTDNRPIYQLDTNIRTLATSMVGVGYGEHTAINGNVLTPGKIVELLPENGQIKYPDSSTAASAILGMVIGSTNAGSNRVVWASHLLDLAALGLDGLVTGALPDSFIIALPDGTGNIYLSSTFTSTSLIVGKVRTWPFITIGKDGQTGTFSDTTPQINHTNLYGINRLRNLVLLMSVGAAPVQYNKSILYQQDISTLNADINPLNIAYSPTTGQVGSAGTFSVTYGIDARTWVVKERFSQFLTAEPVPKEDVQGNFWSVNSYPATLTNGLINYELQTIGSGLDFTQSTNLPLFKAFDLQKYYQYAKVNQSSILYGKPTVIISVLDPQNTQLAGETSLIMVCEFITYNAVSGLELSRNKIVLTGAAASAIYSDTNIFPSIIKSA